MVRVFQVSVPTSVAVLILSEMVLLVFCYSLAAFLLSDWMVYPYDPVLYLTDEGGLARVLLIAAVILFGLHFFDLYSEFRTVSRIGLVLEIGQALGLAFLFQALVAYASPGWMLPKWIMILGSSIALVAVTGWRLLYHAAFLSHLGRQRVLFVGRNAVVLDVAEYVSRRPETGVVNLGYVDDGAEPGTPLLGAKVLGPIQHLERLARELHADRVVVGMTERRDRMPVQELLSLRFSGIPIEEAGAMYEVVCGRICTKELRPSQLIFSGELGPRRSSVANQAAYTLPLALLATILTLPVMLLAALLVKLTSRGPALYRQKRVGLGGAPFTVYKFRSMRVDAEAQTGAVWATKDDPRITPVGRWLRKLRIDELPQLWNVLRGEMSLVGPRPERPEFVQVLSEKIPYYPQRHSVKPGITGWAQINHKYGDTIEDTVTKLEFDLYYIKHMSLSLDLYILFHTLKTMVRQKGSQ